MTLVYQKYNDDLVYIKNGYLTNAQQPRDSTFFNEHFWCEEANTIIKINNNEEGYFDFSKSLLDIGAFVGVYSFMTKFDFSYAFEPNFESYSLLNVNMLHYEKKFKSYNVLLSDKKEYIKYDGFNCDAEISGKSAGKDFEHAADAYDPNKAETYMTHTIDEYNCNNIGLIKIDVEGMEEKVLRGALGTIIRNNYPPILFELWQIGQYTTQEKFDSLTNFIKGLGYEILWNWGDIQTHLAIKR